MLFDYNTDYTNIYLLQLSFIIIIMFTNKKMSISNLYLFFSLPQFPDKGTSWAKALSLNLLKYLV